MSDTEELTDVAEEQAAQSVPDGTEAQADEDTPKQEPNYKELFEEQKRYSRSWERKCKDNAQKLKELEADAKKLAEQTEELQELRRQSWVMAAADETGVPKEVLKLMDAATKDELIEKAKAVAAAYGATPKAGGLPVILGDGAHVNPKPKMDANQFIRAAFSKNHK